MKPEEINNILSSVEYLDADTLANYIFEGYLTLEQLMDTGELIAAKRKEIEEIISGLEEDKRKKIAAEEEEKRRKESNDWKVAKNSKSVELVSQFIEKYPNGNFYNEAIIFLDKLNSIVKEKSKILDSIRNESSKYTPDDILEFIESGHISKNDLLSAGIPEVIVENLHQKKVNLSLGQTPESIEKGYTEVYFWGLPGSGKTCALSAILSSGVSSGEILTNEGFGIHYMNQLSNVFLTDFGVLPAPTHEDQTQYLPFDLRDSQSDNHPIALIELSGEIFKAFYKKKNNLQLSPKLEVTYQQIKTYLQGENKKIHFFVIDVTVDPRKPIKGDTLTQQQYLNAMSLFLSNNNILRNSAEGVFIIATKSDKLSSDFSIARTEVSSHLETYYPALIKRLKDAIKDNKIGDGKKVEIIPFSLGQVYFNDLCYFDDTSSKNIIKVLQNKTRKRKKSGLKDKLFNFFNR